ncbi:MAG: potassium channel protein [Herbiconiux sp.]|uniref:potassium channel family protein n=1 Tax=Herbiconiux sp. TaxID=1871186 RepID=UPI0011F69FD8|nr:potassium channel family protein [Herbiconiux sp.]TAJ47858.1 MAG: potassium channel protein [Herbiconiux sp.]
MNEPHDRRASWEASTGTPLVSLSLVFIVCYSVVVIDTGLEPAASAVLNIVIAVIWVAFATDYVVRLALATHKLAFVRSAPLDLLSVAVPVFRPFLLLTRLKDVPYFRRHSGSSVRLRLVIQATLFVVLFVYSISLAELSAERGAPGATIDSFGDAIWWACVTMTTVGYGDYVPVTLLGRVLAVILMFGGVAIVGVSTATIVSYLNERIGRQRTSR